MNASAHEINITGGEITAKGSGGAAGIGGGLYTTYGFTYDETDGTRDSYGIIGISGKDTKVTAFGSTVKMSSGEYVGGAGIGSGCPSASNSRSVAFTISITDRATVNAYSGSAAQAIGYGGMRVGSSVYTGYGIELNLDDTISLLAINTDYIQPALTTTTDYNDSPITYSSSSKYLVEYTKDTSEIAPISDGDDTSNTDKAIGHLDVNDAQTSHEFSYTYQNNTLYINEYNVGKTQSLDGNWASIAPRMAQLSVEYDGPDIYVGYEANSQDFTVKLVYTDDTEIELQLSDCTVTNPNSDNSLVVPNTQYNTFTIQYSGLTGTVSNLWGYNLDKIEATYTGNKILVGNDYNEQEVEVKYIYTPFSDGTHKEETVTENLVFDSLKVNSVGSNSYTVSTDQGDATFTVPGYKKSNTSSSSSDNNGGDSEDNSNSEDSSNSDDSNTSETTTTKSSNKTTSSSNTNSSTSTQSTKVPDNILKLVAIDTNGNSVDNTVLGYIIGSISGILNTSGTDTTTIPSGTQVTLDNCQLIIPDEYDLQSEELLTVAGTTNTVYIVKVTLTPLTLQGDRVTTTQTEESSPKTSDDFKADLWTTLFIISLITIIITTRRLLNNKQHK